MPIPLVPIIVGVVCFAVGLGAARTIKFVQADGAELDSHEYLGEPCGVLLRDGKFHEGNLQELGSDTLTLEVGEQQFLELPLRNIKRVEVYAN